MSDLPPVHASITQRVWPLRPADVPPMRVIQERPRAPFRGESLVAMLRHRALSQPDDLAFTFLRDGDVESNPLTWSALDGESRRIAARLQASMVPGDRAMLVYPPGLEFISAFFGCLYARVVAVPVLPPHGARYRTSDRLTSIIEDADPRVVLTSEALIARGVPATNVPVVSTDDRDAAHALEWRPTSVDRRTLAFLQYTSGSTATPKGVMVTHGNLLHNLEAAYRATHPDPDSVSVSWLPVTHDMGLIEGVLQPVFTGSPAYLMSPGAFLQRPVRWLKAISRYRATRSGGPNFAYELAVTRVGAEDRVDLDLRSWRAAYNGAEPVRHDTMEAFASAYADAGFNASAFRPCYGLAEATLLVSSGRWSRQQSSSPGGLVSCGVPTMDTKVRIVEPQTERVCDEGEIGEIRVAGPSLARGYWNRAIETAETFEHRLGTSDERWLRTGDLGCLQGGDLYVTGRIKDVLIVRGVKFFPQDLERTAAQQHSAVRAGSVAAVAVAATVRGDRIALIVEVDPRHCDEQVGAQLITRLRQSMIDTHGIQLHGVALVHPGTVPKTTSGKLQRFLCRDAWLRGSLQAIAAWREGQTTPSRYA